MTIPSPSNNYAIAVGTASNASQVPVFETRAPTQYDIDYPLGKRWIDRLAGAAYELTQFSGNPVIANWLSLGSGGGVLNTLSDGSTTVTPTAGNIEILGTTNQITSTGTNSPGAITLSLPNAITTPGSLTTTTSLTAGNGFTATGTAHINVSGAGVTVIGTGGTGAVQIGNATGNTAVTGSLTASTTLTATLGNITATNGNLNLAHTGNKLLIHASTAASDSIGTATLGMGGTVTVSTTAVTASSLIFLSYNNCTSSLASSLDYANVVAGVSFDIVSQDTTDATSTVNYWIIN